MVNTSILVDCHEFTMLRYTHAHIQTLLLRDVGQLLQIAPGDVAIKIAI